MRRYAIFIALGVIVLAVGAGWLLYSGQGSLSPVPQVQPQQNQSAAHENAPQRRRLKSLGYLN